MSARLRLVVTLSLALGLFACGHKRPYAIGQQPEPATLLKKTAPKLDALTVSDASITVNRLYRASLAMLAQTPGRFRGTVSKAGNELVSLAFHEDGYALRYKLDQFPQGFYHGPPHECAVEAMIGVPFSYEGLVALILGGAPLLEEPHQVLEQKWDRKGYEKLIIANDRFVQELRFGWAAGQWRFTGAVLWLREPGGDKGRKLWTLHHEEHENVNGIALPDRTSVRAEGPPDDTLVMIRYDARDTNPPWAKVAAPDPKAPGDPEKPTDDGGWPDAGEGWEDGDEGWEDGDEGWEDGDEGWEDGDDTEPEPEPESEPGAAPGPGLAAQGPTTRPTAGETQGLPDPGPLPPVFLLDGAGLPDRGDLCQRFRRVADR